jgi:transcription initiation factor TFIID subunit 10
MEKIAEAEEMKEAREELLNFSDVEAAKEVERFIVSMETYPSVIPDCVTEHFLSKSGVHCTDKRIVKLISLACQKFASDIAVDAVRSSTNAARLAQASAPSTTNNNNNNNNSNNNSGKSKAPQATAVTSDKRLVLTIDDLSQALIEQGVSIKKPPYYCDRAIPEPPPAKRAKTGNYPPAAAAATAAAVAAASSTNSSSNINPVTGK